MFPFYFFEDNKRTRVEGSSKSPMYFEDIQISESRICRIANEGRPLKHELFKRSEELSVDSLEAKPDDKAICDHKTTEFCKSDKHNQRNTHFQEATCILEGVKIKFLAKEDHNENVS